MSDDLPQHIWVIGFDYGVDGKTEPEMAFKSEGEAKEAERLLDKCTDGTQCYVTKVPLWNPASR